MEQSKVRFKAKILHFRIPEAGLTKSLAFLLNLRFQISFTIDRDKFFKNFSGRLIVMRNFIKNKCPKLD